MSNSFYTPYYKLSTIIIRNHSMARQLKDTPIFCRNCSHSIDYHNPERVNLVCSFQECLCQNYLDHEDLLFEEQNEELSLKLKMVQALLFQK